MYVAVVVWCGLLLCDVMFRCVSNWFALLLCCACVALCFVLSCVCWFVCVVLCCVVLLLLFVRCAGWRGLVYVCRLSLRSVSFRCVLFCVDVQCFALRCCVYCVWCLLVLSCGVDVSLLFCLVAFGVFVL